MTNPVVRIEPTRLVVEPGGQVRALVTVANPGTIVEGFRLDVLGDGPPAWAEVTPAELSLYPQEERSATVVFSLPAQGVPGGVVAFGVRAASVLDPASAAVAEGDLEIGSVHGLTGRLTPVTSTGRWRGTHTVEVTNWGNSPARLRLTAGDPDQRLGFLVHPDVVDVAPGGTAAAQVKVRTRSPFLRGSPVRLPFQVTAEPDPSAPTGVGPQAATQYGDPRRPVVDGALTQNPILSRAAVRLGAAVLVAAAAATVGTLYLNRDAPDKPNLAAGGAGSTAIRLFLDPAGQKIDGYQVYRLDPQSRKRAEEKPVGANLQQVDFDGLEPGTEYCFEATVQRQGKTSGKAKTCMATDPASTPSTPESTPAPTTAPVVTGATPSPAPDTTPPGSVSGPSFGRQWIAYLYATPAGDAAARARAEQARQSFVAQGIAAETLLSSTYPPLNTGAESYVIYLGGFDSQADAQSAGGRIEPRPQGACITRQPGDPVAARP